MSDRHSEMASTKNIATFLVAQDSFPPVAKCDGVTIRKWLFEMNTEFGAIELAALLFGETYQDVLQTPEYRHFAKLAKRPSPDSPRVFHQIVRKITQQSISTRNAMLSHLICKTSKACEPPVTHPENSLDVTSDVLFNAICHRLQLGNDPP
ncbi:hypothetical protein KCU81_g9866, partial [Aureobasidium melanogenum]|uniref:Uncharacterized protein n=2 Tax=Aureobasidium melanogenum TaxID=46634 RepID=A0A074W544_AURM1